MAASAARCLRATSSARPRRGGVHSSAGALRCVHRSSAWRSSAPPPRAARRRAVVLRARTHAAHAPSSSVSFCDAAVCRACTCRMHAAATSSARHCTSPAPRAACASPSEPQAAAARRPVDDVTSSWPACPPQRALRRWRVHTPTTSRARREAHTPHVGIVAARVAPWRVHAGGVGGGASSQDLQVVKRDFFPPSARDAEQPAAVAEGWRLTPQPAACSAHAPARAPTARG